LYRDGEFWGLTSFFNPGGYRARCANFLRFRQNLKIPLALVELSFDGQFEFSSRDADLYIPIDGGSRMWQKERLLNLGLDRLPPECRYVALLDGDIEFEWDSWTEEAVKELDSHRLVHLFDRVFHESADDPSVSFLEEPGFVSCVLDGVSLDECFSLSVVRGKGNSAGVGFGWAARIEDWRRHGLYDGCIVGGGDNAMISAAYGYFDSVIQRHGMNDRCQERYLEWAGRFHETFRDRIGSLRGQIRHFWHGTIDDRSPRARHRILVEHEFDPFTDIAPGPSGAWEWNSDKPELHRAVRDYFLSRREDGVAAVVP